ncbi:MAG TPA: hypothetical protein VIA18_07485 [Polyangia bacterium]|jgi:hypothetical protein|nr:hypothetical protein [Polyangia bacterium]HWE27142.1 hypothetical protein [Polyangia bacterium]
MKNTVVMMFCSVVLFAGCAASNEEANGAPQEPKGVWAGQAKDRASFDMNCPKEQIQLSYIKKADFSGGPVFGARGCNKRASYSADTRNGVVLQSPVMSEAPPQ